MTIAWPCAQHGFESVADLRVSVGVVLSLVLRAFGGDAVDAGSFVGDRDAGVE